MAMPGKGGSMNMNMNMNVKGAAGNDGGMGSNVASGSH